jgi:hypothetical protein
MHGWLQARTVSPLAVFLQYDIVYVRFHDANKFCYYFYYYYYYYKPTYYIAGC